MPDLNLIKKLREATGCGIADCSKALTECKDSYQDAVDWLRKKGLSAAAKKSGRITSEGAVATYITGNKASIVEVNSETDFVARNQKFQDFVASIAKLAIGFGNDVEKLKTANFADHTVSDEIKNQISVIGENINLRRVDNLEIKSGAIVSYVHNAIGENMGKIAVLVALESEAAKPEDLQGLGKQIAMHIAAAKPDALSVDDVDGDKVQREVQVLKEQARSSGKPENIVEKMVQGRIKKYYEEVALLEQNFVMDDQLKIKDLISKFSKEKAPTIVKSFKLFILGEGVEKKENDFAKEVAAMTRN